jgi:hypothetical protein
MRVMRAKVPVIDLGWETRQKDAGKLNART